MRIRHLQTRFILAGILLVTTTIVSGLWSAWTFARLTATAGKTLQVSQRTIDLTAVLSDSLERQDDALLLAVNGSREQAKTKLRAQRQRFARAYDVLLQTLDHPSEKQAASALLRHADEYGAAGDMLLSKAGDRDATGVYYQRVNPALRKAVDDCASIRESNFQSMQHAATIARDEARRATIMVAAISGVALLISALVAIALARSVLLPVQELGNSLEAVRSGDFDRRAQVQSEDELGRLAAGFNRMAEALAEFRRLNLSEVLRAKETLESTLRALPDAVLVIDPEGRIVASNPLAKSVLKASGCENAQRFAELPLPSASLWAVDAALRGARANETRAEFSRALSVSLDGRRCKFMFTVIPIPEFSNGRFGAVAILYDVTDFARLDELRTEVVGVASHELKTPLTTLRMNLMLLAERSENLNALQHEILDTATLGCQQLADTIDELLDLTRIEAGQLRLAHEAVDLHAVVERAAASVRQRFEDAAVTLQLPRGRPAALVDGDPARLAMVFTNLLSNALKYTPAGGSVSIQIAPPRNAANGHAGFIRIAVTDSGAGIPAEFRERVFDKFFRVESHIAPGQSGTRGSGIGLYLCRQIVEAHGGKISCETGDNGAGTRIIFSLPAIASPAVNQPFTSSTG
jgi:NtrC-family two-component system sensor histidine kinase KinB